QKQKIKDTILELVKIYRQKELLCMPDNVDDLIESALNSKLLSINSQRLNKEKQEVKNVVEETAERGNRIIESLQNFRVIRKSSTSLKDTSQIFPVHAITPILSTKEPEHSFSMGYEHFSTTLVTELDEVAKSSIKNLVPIPCECEVTSEDEKITKSDLDFEEEIRLIKNLLYDNSSPRPPKELNAEIVNSIIESIPSSLIPDQDNDSQREKIDIVTSTDELLPPGFENDDDSEEDMHFLKELLSDNSIPLTEDESSDSDHQDDPSFPRPLPEPPDAEFDAEEDISVAIDEFDASNEENDDYCSFMFVIRIFLPFLMYSKMFLSFLFAESEDTIFDPGISIKNRWYQANPKESHLVAVKRFFRYLKGTPNLSLWYPKGSGFDLKAYSDLDYARCYLDRNSTSGGCQILREKIVCRSAKKQSSVAMSSSEAEDHISKGNIELHFVPIELQLADSFTKPLAVATFTRLVAELEHHDPLYHPMLNFLSKCSISTAFTKEPSTMYVEYLKDFWYTAKVNDATKDISFSLSFFKNQLSFTRFDFLIAIGLTDSKTVVPLPPKGTIRAGLATLGLTGKDKPSLTSTELVNSSPLKVKYFSPIWKIFMRYIVKCQEEMQGSHDQMNLSQQVIAYCLIFGLEINLREIILNDLIYKLQNRKKNRELNVCYTRFISLVLEQLLGHNYHDESLTVLKPHHISAASFQTPSACEVSLTSHMLKVAKLLKEPEECLILPSEEATEEFVATVIPIQSLDASVTAEVYDNQLKATDTIEVPEKIVEKKEVVVEQTLEIPSLEQLLKEVDNHNQAVQTTSETDIQDNSKSDLHSMPDDELRFVLEFENADSDDFHDNDVSTFDHIVQDDYAFVGRLSLPDHIVTP
nr:hypothetical protein [Tanacetum cinerariifolium]